MSNVAITVGGRSFTVACAAGEEDHIASLATMIDSKLSMVDGITTQSESRMLLFAALLLADEVSELRSDRPSPSQEPGASVPSGASESTTPELLARLQFLSKLESIARRAENLADSLEWASVGP